MENSWQILYWYYYNNGDHAIRRLSVYRDYYQNTQNYDVVYSHDDFRQGCSLGVPHGITNECYINSSPEGTRAFFYTFASGNKYMYYTPLPGNSCPKPGSWFDYANCRFTRIYNTSIETYTWERHWLAKMDLIN